MKLQPIEVDGNQTVEATPSACQQKLIANEMVRWYLAMDDWVVKDGFLISDEECDSSHNPILSTKECKATEKQKLGYAMLLRGSSDE